MENFKCKLCKVCNGKACIGQMPGMGGPFENKNFILNCEAWKKYAAEDVFGCVEIPDVILGPMTGAVENMGFAEEEPYYIRMMSAVAKTQIKLSLGDGAPDEKLQFGIAALKAIGKKGGVFFKPYPDAKLYERFEWSQDVAEYIGIDTDAYNIVTMRNKVNLENKNAAQLLEFKKFLNSKGMPFVIKGVFTQRDLEIVEQVHPDVALVSNHGGRIETDIGSTADFLKAHSDFLKKHSGAVWVDGGIRTKADLMAAGSLGAQAVMIGRPLVTALCRNGEQGILDYAATLL